MQEQKQKEKKTDASDKISILRKRLLSYRTKKKKIYQGTILCTSN